MSFLYHVHLVVEAEKYATAKLPLAAHLLHDHVTPKLALLGMTPEGDEVEVDHAYRDLVAQRYTGLLSEERADELFSDTGRIFYGTPFLPPCLPAERIFLEERKHLLHVETSRRMRPMIGVRRHTGLEPEILAAYLLFCVDPWRSVF
jgi:hypothetical protein